MSAMAVSSAYKRDEATIGISTTSGESKSRRFSLRTTPKQERLIRVAADCRGLNVTDFIIESACEKAEQTLADKTHFVIDRAK